MSDPVTVEFYFDIVSPYSCFGFERLCRYEKAWNLDIELRPVHLGTILKSSGNFPPFSSSIAKLNYMVMDIKRCARELQLPFNLELNGPPASSFTDMCTIAALKTLVSPKGFKLVVKKLFTERITYPTPPSDILACLAPSCASEEVLARAKEISQSEDFKLLFERQQSDLVGDYGAFGLPWIVLQRPGEGQREFFWGSERMSAISHWLGPEYEYIGASPKSD